MVLQFLRPVKPQLYSGSIFGSQVVVTLFIFPFKRNYIYSARIRLINNKTKQIKSVDLSENLITYTSSLPFREYPSYGEEPIVNLVKVGYKKFANQGDL